LMLLYRADGGGGTGDQGHQGPLPFGLRLRLMMDEGLVVFLGKRLRRHPATGVAVDTGGIDVEVARSVGGQPFFEGRHDPKISKARKIFKPAGLEESRTNASCGGSGGPGNSGHRRLCPASGSRVSRVPLSVPG